MLCRIQTQDMRSLKIHVPNDNNSSVICIMKDQEEYYVSSMNRHHIYSSYE